MIKKCSRCGKVKEIGEFRKAKTCKDGFSTICKSCMRIYSHNYYLKHRQKILARTTEYQKENRAKATKAVRAWYQRNKEYCREKNKKYYNNNRQQIQNHYRKWERTQLEQNVAYRLKKNLRGKLHKMLVKNPDQPSFNETFGYSPEKLKAHLEKQFQPGMAWENYGKDWHIDHIIPISVFNYNNTNDIDFKKCWALSNLQPLWRHENRMKSNKLKEPFQPSFAFGIYD